VTKPNVLVMSSIWPTGLDTLAAGCELHRLDRAENKAAFLAKVGSCCHAVVMNGKDQLGAKELEHLPHLEIVACTTAGYEGVDHVALARRGITLTNASLALKDDVADTAVMLVLSALKHQVPGDAYVRSGQWGRNGPYPLLTALKGKHVGLLGLGTIGTEIALRLQAMRMKIGYFTRSPKNVDYTYFATATTLADWSDVLVVAIPGGPGTKGLVDETVLRRLGPTGTLINIARGSVVDEPALINCLRTGALGSAGLDVYLNEPHPDPNLTGLPNVVLYPHHASGTVETREAMTRIAVGNLLAHFSGQTLISPACGSAQPQGATP